MGKSTKPVSPARRKKIIADYAMCGNYSEVARKHGVTPNTIKNIVQGDPKATKLCEQKAEEQSQDAISYLQNNGMRIAQLLETLLDAMEKKAKTLDMFTNIKDLATAFGIVTDKAVKAAEIAHANRTKPGDAEIDPLSAALEKLAGELDDGEA